MAGLILAFGALAQLGGVEKTDRLVTTGLFARLRHPMYAGFILWIAGWPLYTGAGASAALAVAAIASVLLWRALEQHALEVIFGDQYRTYRRQTWF